MVSEAIQKLTRARAFSLSLQLGVTDASLFEELRGWEGREGKREKSAQNVCIGYKQRHRYGRRH